MCTGVPPCRRGRSLYSLLIVVVVVAGLASDCGTGPHSRKASTGGDATSPTSSKREAQTQEMKSLWSDLNKAADLPRVALRAPTNLKPVVGFQQADVDALSGRAVDILRRSLDPKLSKMDADAAVDYVYAHQDRQTTFDFKSNAIAYTAGYDWQWLAASRFPSTPTPPKVVKVTGAVSSGKGKLDDGGSARYLTVTLQAHVAQTVPTKTYGVVPIVVRRTVRASSFRPRGGPEWWPSIVVRTSPFGNSGCQLFKGARLVPLTEPTELREDLANLKNSLESPTPVAEDFGAVADRSKVRAQVEKYCAGSGQ